MGYESKKIDDEILMAIIFCFLHCKKENFFLTALSCHDPYHDHNKS